MNRSLQEQLAQTVPSLGLMVEVANRKVPPALANKKQEMMNLVNKLAAEGRKGKKRRGPSNTEILCFLDFVEVAARKRKISVVDQFFCLFAIENITEFNMNTRTTIRDQLCKVATKITNLVKIKPHEFTEDDQNACRIHANIIKSRSDEFKNFTSLAREILNLGIDVNPTIPMTPDLDEQDCELSLQWHKEKLPIQANIINTLIYNYGRDYHIGRLLSARAAEKAMRLFYQLCRYDVVDIAITQLDKNNDSSWLFYDLKVNGKPIDVKNARRSQGNRNAYVEHCIRSYKTTKDDLQVTIGGILSQYLWVEHLLAPEDSNIETSLIVLGETTQNKHKTLKEVFEKPYFIIDFSRPMQGSNSFLPAWIFDYPSDLYKQRDEIISHFPKQIVPDFDLCVYTRFNPIPSCIAAGIDLATHWHEDSMRKWEWDFNRELLSCVRIHGLSLPFLYLSILSHFISMVHINLNESELYPEMYRRFVFEVDKTTDKPLGIYDPLKTIHSLINTLNILWTAGPHNRIREFKSFRLSGFNILQGKRELEKNWKTLVAYCGGWKLNDDNGTFLKCGEYPLVLGKSEQCKVCGHLICPTCGFCSTDCQPNERFDGI